MAIKINRSTSANGKKIPKTEIRNTFDNSLQQHDAVRLQQLQGLLTISEKKSAGYAREQQRLSKKYGTADARVQTIQDKRATNLNQIQGLKMEVRRAGTDVPKVNENTWLGHGHVYDQEGCPVKDAEISLYKLDEQRITQISSVRTNQHGYYKIEYTRERSVATPNQSETHISSGLRINQNYNDEKESIFIRAALSTDPDIYADSTPLTPVLGEVNYRDIILSVSGDATEVDRRATRYLGNSSTRELHDLKNEQPACRIDSIRFDHCVNFKDIKKATQSGYDYCAYCFGKDLSKR